MIKVRKGTNFYSVLTLALSNILLQILGFIYRIMLTENVGTEALGLQSLVMQVYSIAVSVCISGINVATVTLSARLSPLGDGAVRKLVSTAFRIYLLLFFIMAIPVFSFRSAIAQNLIGDASIKNSLVLILVCIFLTGIENLLKSIHLGTGRVRTTAASELTEQIARFIIVFVLLKKCMDGSDSTAVFLIILGMVLSEFFSVGFLSVSYIRNYMKGPVCLLPTLKGEFVAILAPAALTGIASTIFNSASSLLLPGRLMIAGYTRSVALGAIGMMNTVAIPIIMFPMAFIGAVSSVFLPAVSEAAGNRDSAGLIRLTRRSMLAALAATFAVNLAFFPFLQDIAKLFFGTVPGERMLMLLSVKAIVTYFQVISSMILNGMMKQKNVLLYAVIGELTQLVLIYYLSAIPFLHVYGYLVSILIGEVLRLTLSLLTIRRRLGVSPILIKDVLPFAFIGILLYLYSCAANSLIINNTAMTFPVMVGVIAIGTTCAILIRTARRNAIRDKN